MTPDEINDFASYIALTASVPVFAFTIAYGVLSPWYKSWLGRTVFWMMFSFSMLFAFIHFRRALGEFFGYEWWAIFIYSNLVIAFWSFLIIYVVERRKPPEESKPLEIVLQKEHKTGEIPITKGTKT